MMGRIAGSGGQGGRERRGSGVIASPVYADGLLYVSTGDRGGALKPRRADTITFDDATLEHLKALEAKYPGLERVMVSLSVGVPQALVL